MLETPKDVNSVPSDAEATVANPADERWTDALTGEAWSAGAEVSLDPWSVHLLLRDAACAHGATDD